jgi:hypothetical protein
VTPQQSSLYEIVTMAVAFALAWLAYRHPRPIVLQLATAVIGTVAATVLFAGELVFPLLYYISRRQHKWRIGWGLLVAMLVTPPILYWRMPWPSPLPNGPVIRGTATVAELHTVRHIGGAHRKSLQDLRLPLQIATMRIAPVGSKGPIVAIDTVDSGSVSGLAKRGTVAVLYARGDARTARIAGATRTYASDLWWYIMETTYGATLTVAVLVSLLGLARPRRTRSGLAERYLKSTERVRESLGRSGVEETS